MEDGEGRVEVDLFVDSDPAVAIYLEVFDTSGKEPQAACVGPTPSEARAIGWALIRAADAADRAANST